MNHHKHQNTYSDTPTLNGLITIVAVLAPLIIGVIGILHIAGN